MCSRHTQHARTRTATRPPPLSHPHPPTHLYDDRDARRLHRMHQPAAPPVPVRREAKRGLAEREAGAADLLGLGGGRQAGR